MGHRVTVKYSASRARTRESTQYPTSELVQIPQAWDKLGDNAGQRSRKQVSSTETLPGTIAGSAWSPCVRDGEAPGPSPEGAPGRLPAGAQLWPWCWEQPRGRWGVEVPDRKQRCGEGSGNVHGPLLSPYFSPQLIPTEEGFPSLRPLLTHNASHECAPSVTQSFYNDQFTEQLLHTRHCVGMNVSPVAMAMRWEAEPRLKFTRGDPAVEPAGAPRTFRCVFGGRGGE